MSFSAQYEVLKPYVNDRIASLVRGRLLEGVKFFEGHTLRPEFSRSEVKLALLMIRIANDKEFFSIDELTILEGRQQHCDAFKPQSSAREAHLIASAKKPKNRG